MVTAPPQTPYATNQELWYYNGTALQSPYGAWNIATMGGSRFGIPVYRGQNIPVPYRAGQNWRAKYPDSRTVTLTMWAEGLGSAAGFPSADQRLGFNNNIQQLRDLFFNNGASGSVQGQLQRNWYWTQNGTPTLVASTAMAEIAGSMDPTMNGRTSASFSVDLLLADPYFYGAQRTQAITTSGTITAFGEGIVGQGFPSTVSAFTVACTAACTVTNTTLGCSFTLSGVTNSPVTIDVLSQTATDSLGNNVIGTISHAGARQWMALSTGANAITVSAGTATFLWMDAYV
jgi:hypothetical protein